MPDFKDYAEAGAISPQIASNFDESGMFYKKVQKAVFIT